MSKKGTAIFFILLANIIILAHAVVPHHHLPHQNCLITSQCPEDKNGHHHPVSDIDHNHDNDNKSDNERCLLNKIIGLPINNVRQICGCNFHTNLHPDLGGFHAILVFFKFECIVPIITANSQLYLLTFAYTSYASSVLGLRAPPTV
jgi:hypothetical protein